jgi:hypothetical protein
VKTPKRESLQTARTPEELLPLLEEKAKALDLYPPSQDLRNDWGPIYFNDRFDLRIDRHPGTQQFTLMLMHKLQPADGLLSKLLRS